MSLKPAVGLFANLHLYSDSFPFEIVGVSASGKRILIRQMDAELDPNWKPEFVPGGFAGHCANQQEQKWTFKSNESNPVIKAYWRSNRPGYYSEQGRHAVSENPGRFHDYNF